MGKQSRSVNKFRRGSNRARGCGGAFYYLAQCRLISGKLGGALSARASIGPGGRPPPPVIGEMERRGRRLFSDASIGPAGRREIKKVAAHSDAGATLRSGRRGARSPGGSGRLEGRANRRFRAIGAARIGNPSGDHPAA